MRKYLYILLILSLYLQISCKKDEDGERNRLRYTVQGTMYKDIDFVPMPDYPLELVLVPPDGSSRDFKTLDRCVTGKNGSYKFNYISKMREGTLLIWQDESKLQKGQAILGPFVEDLELNKNIDLDFTYNRGAFAIVYITIKTQKTFTNTDTLYIAQPINSDANIPFPVKTHINPKNNDTLHLYIRVTNINKPSAVFKYGIGSEDANNAYYSKFRDSIEFYNYVRVDVSQIMKPEHAVLELK
jgi:hypothetical protein